jgi:allophanate hydrolase subunit 1
VEKPAYFTVFHNGVLVHNHTEVLGNTYFERKPAYDKHPDKEPLVLMYHGDPVRFRNIWVREFKELEGKPKQ